MDNHWCIFQLTYAALAIRGLRRASPTTWSGMATESQPSRDVTHDQGRAAHPPMRGLDAREAAFDDAVRQELGSEFLASARVDRDRFLERLGS